MSRRTLELGGRCVNDHLLTESNVYRYPNGKLVCKVCRMNSQRKHKGLPPLERETVGTWNKNKTHCARGHEYTVENTRTKADGSRGCRSCEFDNNRRLFLEKNYGITPETYDLMLEDQGGVCAICKNPPGDTMLPVDHCHGSGHVRGLLCNNCNNGLGRFRDSPELLRAAAAYLESRRLGMP